MSSPLLFVITGVSGAGKSTLISHAISKYNLSFSISHTTRKARKGEKDGEDYHFIDEGEFKKMIAKDEFIEWAEVYGNLYGTSKKEIERLFKKGKNIILDLDIQGTHSIKMLYPDSISVFVLTKNISILRERLEKRGEKEIEKRLNNIKETIKSIDKYDYLLINDVLDKARKRLDSIIEAEKLRIKNLNKKKLIDNFLER